MMPRFYDTNTKTEAIPLLHDTAAPGVVILEDDNPYWQPLPPGYRLTFDYNGVPNGTEEIPPPVYTPEEQAAIALREEGVTAKSIVIALLHAAQTPPDKTPLDQINGVISQIATDTGLSADAVTGQVS